MLAGARLFEMPDPGRAAREYPADFAHHWDQAMAHTARSLSGIENAPPVAKIWLRRPVGAWMIKLSRYTKVRRTLRWVYPPIGRMEWPLPNWVVDHEQLQRACMVLKLNQAPGWTVWMLKNRPTHRVIHNVRHPGGFLNSWRNRWLKKSDQKDVLQRNRNRLRLVAEHDPVWAARFGDIEAMDVERSEIWYWRYSNEVIWEAGRTLAHYQLSVFEDVSQQPLESMRRLYEFADLPWNDQVEAGVRANTKASEHIAGKWRSALEPHQVEIVDTVLTDSPMSAWWPKH